MPELTIFPTIDDDVLEALVALEPCGEFRAGFAADGHVCDGCGWLAQEHGAGVVAFPRRRGVIPTRRAS